MKRGSKNRLLLIGGLTLILSLFCTVGVFANGVHSAEPITVNETMDYDYGEYDVHYYKFVPSQSGTYEINLNGKKSTESANIYDSEGVDLECYITYDEWTNRAWGAAELKKNKTYYLEVEGEGTQSVSIKKHSHLLGKNTYKYSNNIRYRRCRCPGCGYEKYNYIRKPYVSKLTKGRKKITASIRFKNSYSDDYDKFQIQYSTSKKFKKAKIKTVRDTGKASIKGLKARKKYYVRVRAVKDHLYSPWSAVKTVKTK